MADKVYVGDIGTDIIVDCGEDISTATKTKISVKKPDGSKVLWSASIYNTNYLKYTTVANDLNQSGKYKVQASLTLGAWSGLGETACFTVYSLFE